MTKSILSLAVAIITSVCFAFSAFASDLSGYFRVQNVGGKGYVDVRGPFTAEPDNSLEQALTKASTVLHVDADWTVKDGQMMLRLNSLRGQGIEIVGEPIDDYLQTIQDVIFTETGFDDFNEALWNLVHGGYQFGYTSIGRALIQSVIFIIAQRLDDENITDKEKTELADFADRFNKEVASQIDLGIYLEPTASDNYRIVFVTPDLKCVSEWYLAQNDNGDYINRDTFNKGFEAMRQYLSNKAGIGTGEGIDASEVAEMKAWGYELPDQYKENEQEGVYLVTYEQIFADPDLLFNWLKLNVIKFADPERCPKIELQGVYLPSISAELHNHHLTDLLISYFPRAQQNQRIYLTDGKDGKVGHFDFTSQEGADGLGVYAEWSLHEIDDNVNGEYLAFRPVAHDGQGWYASVYTDFPMKAVNPDNTKFFTISEKAQLADALVPDQVADGGYTFKYHELEEIQETKRQQPVIVLMLGNDDPAEHLILPVKETVIEPQPEKTDAHLAFKEGETEITVYVDGTTNDKSAGVFEGFIPEMSQYITLADLVFTSSDESVVTVDADGKLTFQGKAGRVTITASLKNHWRYHDKETSYVIYVDKFDEDFNFADVNIIMYINRAENTQPELVKAEDIELSEIEFTSDNEDVLTVDGEGNVTLHKLGTATIKAVFAGNDRYEAKDATCTINVVDDLVISDDVVNGQYSMDAEIVVYADDAEADAEEVHDQTGSVYRGVFFATSNTEANLKQQGINVSGESDNRFQNDNVDAHLLKTENVMGNDIVWYGKIADGASIPANTAFLLRPTGNEDAAQKGDVDVSGFALYPLLVYKDTVTGTIDTVVDTEEMQPGRVYNLQGIEVKNPLPGHIYIFNGQKILVR